MRDGVVLRADAWTPAGPGRWPVLLQRLPYGRAVASSPVLPHPEQLARRGYAVVVQDVRGRGGSDGRFVPFADDADDGFDSVEWAATLPFCDGQVAMYGFSYQGLNQIAAAALRPPSLRAIAPMMCAPEPYEHWTYEHGCLRWPFVGRWAAQLAAQEAGAEPLAVDLAALPAARALGPEPPPWFREWLENPGGGAYWDALRPDLEAVEVPVFTVLGYFDDFGSGTEALFSRLGAEGVCGPWGHMPWGTRLGAMELGAGASPAVAHAALLAFFDRVLKGGPAAAARVTYYDHPTGWHAAPAWPPARTVDTWVASSGGWANSRHGDGVLERATSAPALDDRIVVEPLVPYPGGDDPLSEESAAEDRRDVLCYTTLPLERGLSLVGGFTLHARVAADAGTHDLVASLVDVDVDGVARRLATGAARIVAPAGEDHEVVVVSNPVAWTVGEGHRLRLDVSGARFPAYDRNPHTTASLPAFATRQECLVATLHVRRLRLELGVAC